MFGASVIWALDVFPTHAENVVAVVSLGLICVIQAIALSLAGGRIREQKQQQQNAAQHAIRPPNEAQIKGAAINPASIEPPTTRDEQDQTKEELFRDRQIEIAKGLNYITLGAAAVAIFGLFFVNRSIQHADRGNIDANRGWIAIDGVAATGEIGGDKNIDLQIYFLNVGRSPAVSSEAIFGLIPPQTSISPKAWRSLLDLTGHAIVLILCRTVHRFFQIQINRNGLQLLSRAKVSLNPHSAMIGLSMSKVVLLTKPCMNSIKRGSAIWCFGMENSQLGAQRFPAKTGTGLVRKMNSEMVYADESRRQFHLGHLGPEPGTPPNLGQYRRLGIVWPCAPHFVQSSSSTRFAAGADGFLILIQLSLRPVRYGEPRRFETMPSQPSAQACS